MRHLILTIIGLALLAFIAGYYSLIGSKLPQLDNEEIRKINKIKMNFVQNVQQSFAIINVHTYYQFPGQENLYSPLSPLQKSTTRQYNKSPSSVTNCIKDVYESKITKARFTKEEIWNQFYCGKRRTLPRNFFLSRPYLHSSGFSFGFLAFETGHPLFYNQNWITRYISFFHVREIKEVISKQFSVPRFFHLISDLDDKSLYSLANGDNFFLSDSLLWTRKLFESAPLIFAIYSRKELDRYLDSTDYNLHPYSKESPCLYRDDFVCWNYNDKYKIQSLNFKSQFLIFGLITLILAIIWLIYNKIKSNEHENERRRLALRVLTHEFRTPITSLMLNIENMQSLFDLLPPNAQDQFLSISSDVYRLKRLTDMSKNYLQANNEKRLIRFEETLVPSINDFIENTILPYPKLIFTPLKNDISTKIDTYWLGICLKNLIENAFNHGLPPVKLSLNKVKNNLEIVLTDSGQCQFNSIEEMSVEFIKGNKSSGSGLGLNIVTTIINEMGAKITFSKNPTTFKINIKIKGS